MPFEKLKIRVRAIKLDSMALYLAFLDRRTPWYAKAVAIMVVAYAVSPIDLIPDFIPVLGMLDDLLLVPAGIILARRLIPKHVFEECRSRAEGYDRAKTKSAGIVAAAVVVLIWILAILLIVKSFF